MQDGNNKANGKDSRGARTKGWCFTSFEPVEPVFTECMEYLVYGKEVCPETSRQHWQSFVYFKNRKRFSEVKKLLGSSVHIEPMRGTIEEADEYCRKDGSFTAHGNRPASPLAAGGIARKREYDKCVALAKAGSFELLPDWYTAVHLKSAVYIYHFFKGRQPPSDLPAGRTCGMWLYGDPGIGKSHRIRELVPAKELFYKQLNKWWDGYDKQKVVYVEDLGHDHAKWIGGFLKVWADRYTFPGEYKGGTAIIRPELFIVTSNYSIEELFPDDITLQTAIKRRFQVHHPHNRLGCQSVNLPYSLTEDGEKENPSSIAPTEGASPPPSDPSPS